MARKTLIFVKLVKVFDLVSHVLSPVLKILS